MESASVAVGEPHDLRQELGRLQEKEALLNHLLLLEREKRVKAEQHVEAEKQACLELRQLLLREKRVHRAYPTSPSQVTLVPQPERGAGQQGEWEGGTVRDGGTTVASAEGVLGVSPRDDGMGSLSVLLDDFSSSIFSQLPSDLQKILGVTTGDSHLKSAFAKAVEAVKGDDPALLERSLASLEGEGTDKQSLLDMASERGHGGCVRVLLDNGCSPNVSSRGDGRTPVHLAARNGHSDSLQLLLSRGGQASRQDNEGQTPLFLALCEGHKGCVERLQEAESSLQAVTKSGYTVLHAAVSGNLPATLRSLLVSLRSSLPPSEVPPVVNHTDKDGNTALHLAASRGYQGCVEVLCACVEVDLNLRDRWNRTALDIATDDCRDILTSKESKEVTVFIQTTSSSSSSSSSGPRSAGSPHSLPPAVAIGRIMILRHHKWSDLELLVDDALQQYCLDLRGPRGDARGLQASRASRVLQISAAEDGNVQVPPQKKTLSLYEALERELATICNGGEGLGGEISRNTQPRGRAMKMDLSGESIATYRVSQMQWKHGKMPQGLKLKGLFSVFGEGRSSTASLRVGRGTKPSQLFITLKGAVDGCLDQLAFKLMLPVAQLREYMELVESHKTLMVHGAQGSGKTLLAKNLAEYLKHKLGPERTQLIHASLHPSLKRDDLFRLLHLNGLLVRHVSEFEDGGSETHGRMSTTSLGPKSHIVILDDLDRVSAPGVLAELLTALEYRGPGNPLWVDAVYGREGSLLYPAGLYYLKERCYFIVTRTSAGPSPLQPVVVDQFAHVSLSLSSEPSASLLQRHLTARLIHCLHGEPPHRSDGLFRAVEWVWQVWGDYNQYLLHFDLPELTTGLRHFLQCPMEPGNPDAVYSWLCGIWNQHLAPQIEATLVSSGKLEGHPHQEVVGKLLIVVTQRVFKPSCPLDYEGTVQLLQSLRGGSEGVAMVEEERRRRKHTVPEVDPPILHTVTSHTSITRETTPPRGATPTMVAFEDMAKNSPRMRQYKPTHPAMKAVQSAEDVDSSSLDGVKLRHTSGGRKTFRKLRSKTIGLFSKDGTGTLPRLFRRGSRTSLASVAEEDTRKLQRGEPRELEDLFDMLSIASSRFEDQRSPVPPPSVSKSQTSKDLPPKFFLPTCNSSPSKVARELRASSPSMPDLLADDMETPKPHYGFSRPADKEFHTRRSSDIVQSTLHPQLQEAGSFHVTNPPRFKELSPIQGQGDVCKATHVHSSSSTAYCTQNTIPNSSQSTSQNYYHASTLPARNWNTAKQKAKSADDLLSETGTGEDDLFRAASVGEMKQWLADGVRRDDSTNGADCSFSDKEAGRDLNESACDRTSDTSSVMSSTLLFSASLGFVAPDSPILKSISSSHTQSKDSLNSRLNNPRPSITMMNVFTDEEM